MFTPNLSVHLGAALTELRRRKKEYQQSQQRMCMRMFEAGVIFQDLPGPEAPIEARNGKNPRLGPSPEAVHRTAHPGERRFVGVYIR
eukprot:8955349-Pyramimonas_sp.AAC.2